MLTLNNYKQLFNCKRSGDGFPSNYNEEECQFVQDTSYCVAHIKWRLNVTNIETKTLYIATTLTAHNNQY